MLIENFIPFLLLKNQACQVLPEYKSNLKFKWELLKFKVSTKTTRVIVICTLVKFFNRVEEYYYLI